MYQDYFRGSAWLWLPLISLAFFFAFFLGVLARVAFGMRNRGRVHELASLPFSTDPDSKKSPESTDG